MNTVFFVGRNSPAHALIGNVQRDCPSRTAARFRRQTPVTSKQTRVQGVTARQDCDGILLEWDRLHLPYSPSGRPVYAEFKHFNIYRSTLYFHDVSGMTPLMSGNQEPSLQSPATHSYKDMYPPANVDLYYAVTIVNGNGQEETKVDIRKVMFIGTTKKSSPLFSVVPAGFASNARVLHHSTAWNPRRNEYLVAFDFDVDDDGVPDQVAALRMDNQGKLVNRAIVNLTIPTTNNAGNQGWPSVAYNQPADEFMIIFQFRSGEMKYFSNKYVIISQRVMSSQTARAASPSVLIKAYGKLGPGQWIDVTSPVLIFNPATGGYVASVVFAEDVEVRKEVVGVFFDFKGKVQYTDAVCHFIKGDGYEPNLFYDSMRKEIYFTCTVESRGVRTLHLDLRSGLHLLVIDKRNASGAHASNLDPSQLNFIGYTNKTFARTRGYYNELLDRLILFWEDTENGRHTVTTASILITRQHYTKSLKPYSCLAEKQIKMPVPVYFPPTNGHLLLWQEQGRSAWVIGGELLQGNLQVSFGRDQTKLAAVYNSQLQSAFVTWQEGGLVFGRRIAMATPPVCFPRCSSGKTCAILDICVSATRDGCTIANGGCSHMCTSLSHWKVQCSCPKTMQLMEDTKTCQKVPPCHGMTPIKRPSSGKDYVCFRGASNNGCPADTYCHIGPAREFSKCCPAPLPSYTVMVATPSSVWKLLMNTQTSPASFRQLQINNPVIFTALAYDPVNKRIYWGDNYANTINRMTLNGDGGVEIVVGRDIGVVGGLAIDAQSNMLYWTDTSFRTIERTNLDGRYRRTLLSGLDKPKHIVLFKPARVMFWADVGAVAKIKRASLDGRNERAIIYKAVQQPSGLAVDDATWKLYWADEDLNKIESSDFLGRRRQKLYVKQPHTLALLNNRLFWSDKQTDTIHSVNKLTGKDRLTVIEGLTSVIEIIVFKSPRPVVHCRDPGGPDYGRRDPNPRPDDGDKYPQGSVINYECLNQFRLHGPVTRKCLQNGSWSGNAPECFPPPRFRETPVNMTVQDGQSVLLRCSAVSSTITWSKDGEVIRGGNFAYLTSGLLILKAYRDDIGWYVCNATNRGGSKVARAYLRVLRPREAVCGKTAVATRGKIVGGEGVFVAGSHPWQVMLWSKREKRHFCGGSLVAKSWVVTAAHCVTGRYSIGDIEVRLGKLFTNKRERRRQQTRLPNRIKIHPQFSDVTYESDIALIHLSREVIYTNYVKPICLPHSTNDLLQPGAIGVVTGWGRKGKGKNVRTRLRKVSLPIVDQATCKRSHPKYLVSNNMFCAGHYNGSRDDACDGDSGGPLAIDNSLTARADDYRWVLVGIVSWGDGCGEVGKYGVYTRVSNFVRWMNSHLDEDD
ncbi:uncharacterized protein LOC144656754 isoform X1 [Oculina patagonica]